MINTKLMLCEGKAKALRKAEKAMARRAKARAKTSKEIQKAKEKALKVTAKARKATRTKANKTATGKRLGNGLASTTRTRTTLVNATATRHT
jgi:hypothetical protein